MRWLLNTILRSAVYPRLPRLRTQPLSAIASDLHHVQRVGVPVGSSGSVNIDLHNLAKVSSSEPLLIYLPPFSTAAPTSDLTQLPRFAQRHAAAVIHYRWTEPSSDDESVEGDTSDGEEINHRRFHPGWPAPIHDTLKAYTWIVENLAPTTYTRRDIYVYGSYLGASLATSLTLTEAHPHERMAVRGCVAYNGIYDWTMFLPDHPINNLSQSSSSSSSRNILEDILALTADPEFEELKNKLAELFNKPSDLFDPFASSCLLFHTPGLLVPPSFNEPAIPPGSPLTDPPWVSEETIEQLMPFKRPRESPLLFPPRRSTLKIPEILLLHDNPPPLPPSLLRRRQRRKKKSWGNNFRTQAEELARLMRRSINKIELKERMKWDEDMDQWGEEAHRRVQVRKIGGNGDSVAAAWLKDRMFRRSPSD
ncbi:hypothetical protein GQX73_g7145 [Xylaria multiplex]|uniref:Alpha/beta hydrolase fold-3 domain-containing protein n=1 Tax=Xylaria multiplex TaxID=323545 RepID=A0A7C8INX4_9PEZI|nr:hypothetical protein GQX73_g7145 [Xylaria multiplex]